MNKIQKFFMMSLLAIGFIPLSFMGSKTSSGQSNPHQTSFIQQSKKMLLDDLDNYAAGKDILVKIRHKDMTPFIPFTFEEGKYAHFVDNPAWANNKSSAPKYKVIINNDDWTGGSLLASYNKKNGVLKIYKNPLFEFELEVTSNEPISLTIDSESPDNTFTQIHPINGDLTFQCSSDLQCRYVVYREMSISRKLTLVDNTWLDFGSFARKDYREDLKTLQYLYNDYTKHLDKLGYYYQRTDSLPMLEAKEIHVLDDSYLYCSIGNNYYNVPSIIRAETLYLNTTDGLSLYGSQSAVENENCLLELKNDPIIDKMDKGLAFEHYGSSDNSHICNRASFINDLLSDNILSSQGFHHYVEDEIKDWYDGDRLSHYLNYRIQPLTPPEPDKYMVTLYSNYEPEETEIVEDVPEGQYELPDNPFVELPERVFVGWSTSRTDDYLIVDKYTEISGNTNLYAIWRDIDAGPYQITYSMGLAENNKTYIFSAPYGYGLNVMGFEDCFFTNPVGKQFDHWKEKWTKKDNIHPGDKYVVGEDDVYFEAVYINVGTVRTIHIDSNGGEGDAQTFEVLNRTDFVLPNNFYTKENNIFKGWLVYFNGDNPHTELRQPMYQIYVDCDIDIAAEWYEPQELNIEYVGNIPQGGKLDINKLFTKLMYDDGASFGVLDPLTDINFVDGDTDDPLTVEQFLNYSFDEVKQYAFKATCNYPGIPEIGFNISVSEAKTISFNANGGKGSQLEDGLIVAKDDVFILPESTFLKENYHFKAWEVNGGSYENEQLNPGEFVEVSDNLTIKIIWELDFYNLTYKAGEGTGDDVFVESIHEEYSLIKFEDSGFVAPEGKVFAGWQIGEDAYEEGEKINVISDVEVTAIYETIKYNITFSANGGTGTKESVEVDYGQKYELPANPFTAPKGKEFAGWKVNGEGDLLEVGSKIDVNNDIQLIAQWKDKPVDPEPQPEPTYTVSFSSNGGTGTMADVPEISGEYTLPANGFTAPEGKEFAGWKVNGEGDLLEVGSKINVTSNIQLIAQWKDKTVDPEPQPEPEPVDPSEELAKYKEKAITVLTNYYTTLLETNEYSSENKTALAKAKNDCITAINAATDKSGVDAAVTAGQAALEAIPVEQVEPQPEPEQPSDGGGQGGDVTPEQPAKKKGCGGSVIAASALISIVSLAGVALLFVKKKQD